MAGAIDESDVKALPAPESGSKITYDREMSSFGVRVTAAGARAFVLNCRTGGRQRRMTVGSFPDWSVSAAREEAKILKLRIDRGEDPMGDRHRKRAEPTVYSLCDHYLAEHVIPYNKPSTEREVRFVNTQIRRKLGKLKISEVTRAKLKTWHSGKSAIPTSANRALAALSKIMSLTVHEWEVCPENVCKGVERFLERQRAVL